MVKNSRPGCRGKSNTISDASRESMAIKMSME